MFKRNLKYLVLIHTINIIVLGIMSHEKVCLEMK